MFSRTTYLAGAGGYAMGYLSFKGGLFGSAEGGASSTPRTFLKRVKVVGYSVLGSQLADGKFVNIVGPPPQGTALVDPAGLPYVSGVKPPGQAGAASKAIYSWCGLRDAPAFPEDVSRAITKPGDAKAHTYMSPEGEKSVVHVVGPDFRTRPHGDSEALATLSKAYANVLREVAALPKSVPRVRLLPISGGVFLGAWEWSAREDDCDTSLSRRRPRACPHLRTDVPLFSRPSSPRVGDFKPDLTHLTMKALEVGFSQLSAAEQDAVLSKELEMCVFLDSELKPFQRAHAFAVADV